MRGFDKGLNRGLVLSLPFSEGTGLVTRDVSKYRNHGTITGATWTQLPSGLWVLGFDGNDDVNCGAAGNLNLATAGTILMWFNQTTAGSQALISKDSCGAGTREWGFYMLTDRLMGECFLTGSAPATIIQGNTTTLTTNIWYFVALRIGEGNLGLYLNGISDAAPLALAQFGVTAATVYVGFRPVAPNYFIGKIALPRIYNRALSPIEIREIFHRERYLFGV